MLPGLLSIPIPGKNLPPPELTPDVRCKLGRFSRMVSSARRFREIISPLHSVFASICISLSCQISPSIPKTQFSWLCLELLPTGKGLRALVKSSTGLDRTPSSGSAHHSWSRPLTFQSGSAFRQCDIHDRTERRCTGGQVSRITVARRLRLSLNVES